MTFRFIIFTLLLLPFQSHAHMTSMGQFRAEVKAPSKTIEVLVSISHRDLTTFLKVDKNKDKKIDKQEWSSATTKIIHYLVPRLVISNNALICPTTRQHLKRTSATKKGRVLFYQRIQCKHPLQTLVIENKILFEDQGGYRHYSRIKLKDKTNTTIFSNRYPSVTLQIAPKTEQSTDGAGKQEAPSTYIDLITRYLVEGFEHILGGLDHLVFVLCLLLAALSIRQLVYLITAFTLGHSVTLILCAIGVLKVPQEPIEALIALTIAYVAVENIVKPKNPSHHRPIITFVFGLIHGVGFSYNLQYNLQLGVFDRVSALFMFNLGIEIGQLLIVLLLFPVLYKWLEKTWYPTVVRIGSVLIFGLAAYWFVIRTIAIFR